MRRKPDQTRPSTGTGSTRQRYARFNLQERDAAHQLAFTITYRGNAVETCDGTTYGPANNEAPLFGSGFPDFLVAIRDECRPH